MRDYLRNRIISEGKYIIENNATVRSTAKAFSVSKSTVHKDVTKRLNKIDKDLFLKVKSVLKINLSVRHIRGGEATKKRYEKLKSLSVNMQN